MSHVTCSELRRVSPAYEALYRLHPTCEYTCAIHRDGETHDGYWLWVEVDRIVSFEGGEWAAPMPTRAASDPECKQVVKIKGGFRDRC